ncbi:FtsK/SpoIIIE domain-containing protein [Amycolatopsis sp. NPDC052450]|uniref:FtsK/SpoIIIE domain-containing protein n=1 Tax=Amycolatopsis sp. NPDC052450 TaxID=3363937 RepID=UPI0037C656A0
MSRRYRTRRRSLIGKAARWFAGWLVRRAWRHRAALAPVWVAAGLTIAGLVLFLVPGAWWLVPAIVGPVAGVAVHVWGARFAQPLQRVLAFFVPDGFDEGRKGVLDREVERAYLAVLLAVGGGWIAILGARGLSTTGIWQLGGLLFLFLAAPWWWHRRIRRTGRGNRFARRWPVVTEDVLSFRGSKVLPTGVETIAGTKGGTVLAVKLASGKTIEDVAYRAPAVGSVFNLRKGAVTISPGRTERQVAVRILPRDPWQARIEHPLIANPRPHSLAESSLLPMGVLDDGRDQLFQLRHLAVVGQNGSGKSAFLESLLVWLLSSVDAAVIGADMAAGATLGAWESALAAPLATTTEDAVRLLVGLEQVVQYREGLLADGKRAAGGGGPDVLEVSPEMPWLVAILEEFPDLVAEGGEQVVKLVGRIAKRARKTKTTLVLAAQNSTKTDMGSTELRAQLGMAGFRLDSQQSKTSWGELRGRGYTSVGLPTGVFLLHDQEHDVPRQSKGFFVTPAERARFLAGLSGARLLDGGSAARLLGADGGPVHAEAERIEREDVVPPVMPTVPVQRMASKRDQVAELLSAAPASPAQLREATGFADSTMRRLLAELETEGRARREGRGKWVHAE